MQMSTNLFMWGTQCQKRLWLEVNAPHIKSQPPSSEQLRATERRQVSADARNYRGPGPEVDFEPRHPQGAQDETRALIAEGVRRIYRARFGYQELAACTDIIEKLDNGTWRLIAVKATLGVREVNVPELAFQAHVLNMNGLSVSEVLVLHLNGQCNWPAFSELMAYSDITEQVLAMAPDVPAIAQQLSNLTEGTLPEIDMGSHCVRPGTCPFRASCKDQASHDRLQILPGLTSRQANRLRAQGWHRVSEIADLSGLNEEQKAWTQAIQNSEPFIDSAFIQNWLGQLEWPLHSLDFDTISYAVPRWNSTRPYQSVPFQFSCHIQEEDGWTSHHEHLHTTKTDPRPQLIDALLDSVKSKGSILAWNAAATRSVIRSLAREFPNKGNRLLQLLPRIVDVMEIFERAFLHPKALGDASLKSVSSAVLRGKLYDGMVIQPDEETWPAWHEMVFSGADRRIMSDLRIYRGEATQLPLMLIVQIRKVAGLGPKRFLGTRPIDDINVFPLNSRRQA